jgi:hypothetical protein
VLPFQNMSGDLEQDHFCDGLVEDIITTLSKLAGLKVIARNSSFVYKGRSFDVREAAKQGAAVGAPRSLISGITWQPRPPAGRHDGSCDLQAHHSKLVDLLWERVDADWRAPVITSDAFEKGRAMLRAVRRFRFRRAGKIAVLFNVLRYRFQP